MYYLPECDRVTCLNFIFLFKFPSIFVRYRDFCDKERYKIHDFSYNHDALKKFISKTFAKGGGDVAEDMQGGLHQALQLSW